ncbi:MAG: sigma-54 dependent transcriptional regulator [Spirochaetales bacterium]|uniref:Sigma-54 dependent transcriptional regulator n=1 Tax=Candidatus Thalassospirochaeta sargassi TaxID=3119039 RepID=A0AAJ1MKA6_9SPIO|nr:sigma-54 dependent transcriptional regulator [Spirochaetales bacterium]
MKFNLLVVDDEKNIREGLGTSLEMDGYNIYLAGNGEEAMGLLNTNDIDLIITDLRMPVMSGQELLKKVISSYPGMPVIILTGHGTIETAVTAMRDGAYDFLTKPVNLDRLTLLVKRALRGRELMIEHRELKAEVDRLKSKNKFSRIIGKSSSMMRVMEVVEQVAATKASVLITGESGVGKELIADAVHELSDRKDKAFIKVHCAALSESLLESELFGHEKGAFTGALARKRGRFELSHLGSIFLDEIGEINQSTQIKILRVLQEKKFERVGGEDTVEIDTRIISATNRDLKEEIEKGNFREDLFYRLNVVNIHVPPLRERKEDISLLASAFLADFVQENGRQIEGFDHKAMLALHNHGWPGNVRELRNCIESAVVMCKGDVITPEDLPPSISQSADQDCIKICTGSTLADAEKHIIIETLNSQKGNKSKTAEVLGIGRKTLHRKLGEYGLDI